MGTICKHFLFLTSLVFAREFHVIALQDAPNIGMFAAANQILGNLSLYENNQLLGVSGFTVDFGKNGCYYDPAFGPNWWTYYFEPIEVGTRKKARIIYSTSEAHWDAWNHRYSMTRDSAAKLVNKYIHVKSSIQEKIDSFKIEFFQDYYVIGVH